MNIPSDPENTASKTSKTIAIGGIAWQVNGSKTQAFLTTYFQKFQVSIIGSQLIVARVNIREYIWDYMPCLVLVYVVLLY